MRKEKQPVNNSVVFDKYFNLCILQRVLDLFNYSPLLKMKFHFHV